MGQGSTRCNHSLQSFNTSTSDSYGSSEEGSLGQQQVLEVVLLERIRSRLDHLGLLLSSAWMRNCADILVDAVGNKGRGSDACEKVCGL